MKSLLALTLGGLLCAQALAVEFTLSSPDIKGAFDEREIKVR